MYKILVVDDDFEILKLMRTILEMKNYQVTTYQEVTAPININNFKGFDLILLDVMMPEMDGPTALQELRKLSGFETIPAIFMTAKIQPDEIANYKRIGAIDVITKPFDPMTLAETIKTIWERYLESCPKTK